MVSADSSQPPNPLAGLRSRIDNAICDAADRAATAAGGRILTAARVPHTTGVTWSYYMDGHLGGVAEVSTPRDALEQLCAAISALTGGEVEHKDGPPAIIEVAGWIPGSEGTEHGDRLYVSVHGLLPDPEPPE
jgi:hypothetical protein